MGVGLLVQYVVIALAVLASLGVVMHKQFPATTRKVRIALALPLLRDGRAGWMKALGRRVGPPPARGEGGCGGCDGCD